MHVITDERNHITIMFAFCTFDCICTVLVLKEKKKIKKITATVLVLIVHTNYFIRVFKAR